MSHFSPRLLNSLQAAHVDKVSAVFRQGLRRCSSAAESKTVAAANSKAPAVSGGKSNPQNVLAVNSHVGISRGAAEKAAGVGYVSALLFSLVGFTGGAAYVYYENEEKHTQHLKGLPHMAPYAGLSLRQLCGVRWFEVGGIKPAPQSQLVGTSFELFPEEVHGSRVGAVSLKASTHLVSLWAPALQGTLGVIRPNSKHTATATTLSKVLVPEYATWTSDLWVLDAGMANGDKLKSHDSPDWLLVVNGTDRRAAWLLSRDPLVTSSVHLGAMQKLQRLGFDVTKWTNTTQSLPLYGSPQAAAAAHTPLNPIEDPLDTEDAADRAAAARRAAKSPPAVTDLAKRALHSGRAAAVAAGEEVQSAVQGSPLTPAAARRGNGAKSPHDMAVQLLNEVRSLRASDELDKVEQQRQLRQ